MKTWKLAQPQPPVPQPPSPTGPAPLPPSRIKGLRLGFVTAPSTSRTTRSPARAPPPPVPAWPPTSTARKLLFLPVLHRISHLPSSIRCWIEEIGRRPPKIGRCQPARVGGHLPTPIAVQAKGGARLHRKKSRAVVSASSTGAQAAMAVLPRPYDVVRKARRRGRGRAVRNGNPRSAEHGVDRRRVRRLWW
jgi:hypothetical protein